MNTDTKFAKCLTGKCSLMCPTVEINLRIRERLVHSLEKSYKNGSFVPDPDKMVKEYSRPAAGKSDPQPDDLRPPDVLDRTVDYLLGSIISSDKLQWNEIYDFIFDRLRCVRQDMVIQDIGGTTGIKILEKIVRFHIYAGYRLCTEPMSRFDPKINNQHTQECLKRLIYLYSVVPGHHDNRQELESVYLVYNLGQTDALMHNYDLSCDLRYSPMLRQSYRTSIDYMLGNSVRCLRFVHHHYCREYPILLCAFHHHIANIQRQALERINTAYSSKLCKYPMENLKKLLLFIDNSHVIDECKQCGITVSDDELSVCFLKSSFKNGKVSKRHLPLIDNLLTKDRLPDALMGGVIKPD